MKSTKDVIVNVQRSVLRRDKTWGEALGWPYSENRKATDPNYKWELHTLKSMPKGHRMQTITTTLWEVMTKTLSRPSYFLQYRPTKAMVRINKDVFDNVGALEYIGGCLEMHLAIFDMDSHPPKKTWQETPERPWKKEPEVVAWYAETLEKIRKLQAAMPGLLAWRSNNGYRLLALLDVPIVLKNHDDRRAYKRTYGAWVRYLARAWGISTHNKVTADDLGDYGRLMRVPRHADYPVLPIYGDVSMVGYWRPNLIEEDYPAIKQLQRSTKTNKYSNKPVSGALLHQLIINRGDRCEHKGGSCYSITCPDIDRHSTDSSYDTKTYLYTDQGSLGAINCMSSGCSLRASDPTEWLKFFSEEEIVQAEQDLGRIARCGQPTKVKDLYNRNLSPRAIELIACGKPTREQIVGYQWEHSRDHDKDLEKTEGQWIHECICALKQSCFSNEEIAGILLDPVWGISALTREKEHALRFILLMVKNADEAIRESAKGPTKEQFLEFARWFRNQSKWKSITDPAAWQAWNTRDGVDVK